MLANIEQKIRQDRGRFSKIRSAIIEIISNSSKPLSAQEIRSQLANQGLEPDKATIYRQISFLVRSAIIREVRLNEKIGRYEFVSKEHIHHLICQNCDQVSNIELKEDLEQIEQEIRNQQGFKVKQHTLEFYGICAACAQGGRDE